MGHCAQNCSIVETQTLLNRQHHHHYSVTREFQYTLLCLFPDLIYLEGLTSILEASLLSNQKHLPLIVDPQGTALSAEQLTEALLRQQEQLNKNPYNIKVQIQIWDKTCLSQENLSSL